MINHATYISTKDTNTFPKFEVKHEFNFIVFPGMQVATSAARGG